MQLSGEGGPGRGTGPLAAKAPARLVQSEQEEGRRGQMGWSF